MKLRLRYVLVFAAGMLVMYALIAGNVIQTPASKMPLFVTTTIDTGSIVDTGVIENDTLVDVPNTTGSNIDTGTQPTITTGTQVSGSNDSTGVDTSSNLTVDEVVAVFEGSGETDIVIAPADTVTDNTNLPLQTKAQACAQVDGSYANPLSVFWSNTVKASTQGYLKHQGVLHYIVNVSNGTKFYYFHVCSTGVATQATNITNTSSTKAVLSNGQVILQ